MIEAWFNERGYWLLTSKGESRFVYDLPAAITDNAAALYACRWMILNQVMTTIEEMGEKTGDKDLVLHTDSRLIEELQGELTPDSEYAKSSLQYFIECDYIGFRRVAFNKCAATTVNGKLSEPVNTTRPPTT